MWKNDKDINTGTVGSSSKISTAIGQKSITVGEVKGGEDLLILGSFEGTINLSKNTVNVGKTGAVKGTINSQAIMVEGKIDGDLNASERVILRSTAKVKGNIVSSSLVMEDGCYFQGNIEMLVETAKTITPNSNQTSRANSLNTAKKTA